MAELIILRGPLNAGLSAFLEAATERPVRVMDGPRTDLQQAFGSNLPYSLIDPLEGALFSSQWGSSWRDAEVPYRIISYGLDGASAEAQADLIRKVFIDVERYGWSQMGYDIIERRPDGGPDRPEMITRDLWSVGESFVVHAIAS